MNEKREKLVAFLNSIVNQNIVLEYVEFSSNPQVGGQFTEGEIHREFELKKLEIGEGKGFLETPRGKKEVPVFKVSYEGSHFDRLKNADVGYLVKVKFKYSIIIFLDEKSAFLEIEQEEKKEILRLFAESTGKLMVIPYIRHLIHYLTSSAGILLPPINPILLKRKKLVNGE